MKGIRRLSEHPSGRRLCEAMLLGILACMLPVAISPAADLELKLLPLAKNHQGTVALAVKHLTSGESFAYRGDEPMPTASLIKFPVMVEAYRQAKADNVELAKVLTLREEDQVPGSGILTPHLSPGTEISLRDAIRLMIAYSDNTATNLVLDQIGIKAVARFMEELGLPNTKIHAKVFRRDTSVFPERSRQFGLGSTTANETLRLYEKLHARELVDKNACEAMLDHLLTCDDNAKLVRFLPAGTKVAHKGGSISTARCDAGIIFSPAGPIAICVLTSENKDRRWDDDNSANRLCAEIARQTFRHFNPHVGPAAEETPEILRIGADGRLVEDLQRTLNARLDPSPDLSVDGDFGPMTQAAVVRFQQGKALPANGEVNAATWEALGVLISQDPPIPTPETVNSEELKKQPADELTGPPFVTCKAWAIADGHNGQLLWEHKGDEPLDFASTTKVMTAYLVLKLAEETPDVLEETVTFSPRADATFGSTAGVRAGEQLTVNELMYGLLLPSGNDASVALAEHFGERLSSSNAGQAASDSLQQFVAEMNRTAQSLGMKKTIYCNPHGLTESGHVATAADLARLAHAALQIKSFRGYVRTRQHGSTLHGSGGYQRHVVWKNTNRLLATDGYLGIKTGTTGAAGACLISTCRRGDDQLIMVVLGAKSSEARYVDSRNLYRWAWRQRGESPGT